MNRTITASLIIVITALLTGCGRGTDPEQTSSSTTAAIDLSLEARKAAAVEAATRHFQETIKDTFLSQPGMTVRGLVRATTQKTAKPAAAALRPEAFNPAASSSAKLELNNGRVIYTLVSQAFDAAAAVIEQGDSRYLVAYEVEAKVTADGELADVVVTHVGEPTRAN
jgi:hypothetical protein